MALAKVIDTLVAKLPGRGRVKFGVWSGTLTGYVNGTGLAFSATTVGLTTILAVVVQPINVVGGYLFDYDPSTGYIKAYARSNGAEASTNGLDSLSARVIFFGF